jgi:hypothetical protein
MRINCPNRCGIPANTSVAEIPMPMPDHVGGDIVVCPFEDCHKAFLITRTKEFISV